MSKVEKIKKNSNYLRGTLSNSLVNNVTGALAEDDQMIVKFHGSYQQDDRDRRSERAKKKLEKLYSFMLRLRIAGGVISAKEWLGIDEIATKYANETIKVTTRQTVQLHGIIKSNLKPTIATFDKFGMDSIAACGDVNRNVMSSTIIAKSKAYDEVYEIAKEISDHLLPQTNAYNEIWLDDEKISPDKEEETLYKETYLPRKFKISIAIPPSNDVDVYAHDVGLVAIIQDKELLGFNVIIGGGMGRTHGNAETFARVGDLVGFIKKEQILEAIYQIATIQRDYGNRQDRAKSRFKYTIDKYGVEWFKSEFSTRFGKPFEESHNFELTKRGDYYGWDEDYKGQYHYVQYVENGRITGKLRELLFLIAKDNLANFRFSNNQNIIISDILESNKAKVEAIISRLKINNDLTPIRLDAIACVALNTCSLALAEGQRYLPSLISKIEDILAKNDLKEEPISIRMTGCPNGCGRPYLADIGLVGRSMGKYDLMLGGDNIGTRLNKIYKESLAEEQILNELGEIFHKFSLRDDKSQNFSNWQLKNINYDK